MEDFNSKYSGEQVEAILDAVANGEAGGGGGGITVETDPVFSASPAASITEEKKAEWDNKVDKVSGKQLSTEDFTSALKTKLEGLSNYDDTELSNALSSLQTQFNTLVSGNASDAINSFNEIIAFLDGVKDTEDLSSIIASIEQQIAAKQDKIEGLKDINEKLEQINNIVDEEGYLYSNGEKVDMRFTRSLLPVGTSIPAKANLNTIEYLKIGKYYCSLNVDAKTITNCPTAEAFSMEVFNPLGTNVDDETTKEYTYRVRVLTAYKTGMQYIQYCATSGTPGSWTYNSWKVVPQTAFTLNSSKNGGSAAKGANNRGIYIDSTGTFQQLNYTIATSVPSGAVFTDTKVTAVGNHYTPTENASSQIDAPDGEVVTGIKRDAAGHVVGVVTAAVEGGEDGATFTPSVDANGNLSWTNDKGLTNPPTVNIKGPKGDSGEGGSGDVRKEVIWWDGSSGDTITGMRPNVIYWVLDNLNITIESFEEASPEVESYDLFTAILALGAGYIENSLTLPDYVLWANGTIPELDDGGHTTYELSISRISDGYGYIQYYAVLTPFKPVE